MSATQAAEILEWYEATPERLEWELAEFAARELPASAEADADGRMVITTVLPFAGEPVELRVSFPHDYPDVEPTAYGPSGLLTRHQARRMGNFCLLEDPALDWWPTMSAAGLVDEDLRWLLEDSAIGPRAVGAGEADMPEPFSQHVAANNEQPVIVPEPFWARELAKSNGNFVVRQGSIGRSFVLCEADGLGDPDADLIGQVQRSEGSRHAGRWTEISSDAVPTWPTHRQLLEAGLAQWPQLLGKLKGLLERERRRQSAEGFVGLTFIEEGPRRGEQRRGWVFMKVRLDRHGDWEVLRAHRAQAFTRDERGRRLPELDALGDARVAVIGAGSLGAPIAAELVKAGVGRTHVVDHDHYDVNNAVRHLLEPRWAGVQKAIAVAIEIGALNPFVEVTSHQLEVGGGRQAHERLAALLEDVDIVVDATGSSSAARILQRRCREHGKPLVLASLTAGSYGGEVAVFRPDGPCFWCFVLGQRDGSVPAPAEGPRSNITPVACSTPAFSGAGFDASALAAMAARTVVQTYGRTAYPAADGDYMIVNFRGEYPCRQGYLEVHPECPLAH